MFITYQKVMDRELSMDPAKYQEDINTRHFLKDVSVIKCVLIALKKKEKKKEALK